MFRTNRSATGAIVETANDYRLVSWLFLRLLALIYLAAFVSLAVQIAGLAGPDGILPYRDEIERLKANFGANAFWASPSLLWLGTSETALETTAWAGAGTSLLLFFGRLPRLSLVLLFLLYLSLFHAGQTFMNFQWDYLLLEAGFLGIFLARGNSRTVIWLFRWLLFRLRFMSGAAKLISQDPSWAGFTALGVYFETQPIPHVGAWYAHQLPEWLLKLSVGGVFFVELIVPFMMFLPRRPRLFAAWATLIMQVLILFTSNHNFFNILTIVLCLFLFDDRALSRVMPSSLVARLSQGFSAEHRTSLARGLLPNLLATAIITVSLVQMWEMLKGERAPEPFPYVMDRIQPFHVVNKYHVFPTIKTQRIEVVIEGSQDGQNWRAYEFKYKPGDLERAPPVVIPHQPRLDWLMWFVPPGHPIFMELYDNLLHRLLANSGPVVNLLDHNPFGKDSPRYIRSGLYRYKFTDPAEKASTGKWWKREYLGPFHPWPWLESSTPAR